MCILMLTSCYVNNDLFSCCILYFAVSLLDKELSVPVICKIRVFEDIQQTVRYAKMLEAAGCQVRLRDGEGEAAGCQASGEGW